MKSSKTKSKDTFQNQIVKFNSLLTGAKMAQFSSALLIGFSLAHVYNFKENIVVVMSLLVGALALLFFLNNFLSIKHFKQKSYTHTSLISSVSKFKSYIAKRKKYEMYFMSFWALTLVPYAAIYFDSNILGIVVVFLGLGLVGLLGELAFKKVDKLIMSLEDDIEKELVDIS
ncbi:hypothetical protein [Psychroserpens damuponensis]|uniref:hypothetical protein n=1 Tax=Psychroserpens damuponensis TaxID=943936 RepID=UPI00058CBD6C|nr:hypothetical protein [Psychroserpens damuponensis]